MIVHFEAASRGVSRGRGEPQTEDSVENPNALCHKGFREVITLSVVVPQRFSLAICLTLFFFI